MFAGLFSVLIKVCEIIFVTKFKTDYFYLKAVTISGVTESLFGEGPDLRLRGGGGLRGRHRNEFFLITFIVHNEK